MSASDPPPLGAQRSPLQEIPGVGQHNSQHGRWLQQLLQVIVQNPIAGTPVYHHQGQLLGPDSYTPYGAPHYLSRESGEYSTGIRYEPNPANPLRGFFCRAPVKPFQAVDGVYYVAEMELYLPIDLGEVFKLDDKLPKRQDKFVINGIEYFAIAPSLPCVAGESIACWKIDLNRGRYPATPNG